MAMKLNVANPATGCQKLYEFDDERKVRIFYDKKMAQEVEVDALGEEFKGYVVKITGGNDKQGFAMVQGVMLAGRVRLLLDKNSKTYRPRRKGERKRKSVRGCIVGPDMAVLNLVIVKKGEQELPGLTDKDIPQRLGPKRASKIRKLFNLEKQDDVRKYVVRRVLPKKEGKRQRTKAPKIQILVTPRVLQHKRRRFALKVQHAKESREQAADYAKLLAKRRKEAQSKRQALISARRASSKKSTKSESAGTAAAAKSEKKDEKKKAPAATKKAVTPGAKKEAAPKKEKAGLAKPAAPKKGTKAATAKAAPKAKAAPAAAAKPKAKASPAAAAKPKAKASPAAAAKPKAKASPPAAAKPKAKASPAAAAKPKAKASPAAAAKPKASPAAAAAKPKASPAAAKAAPKAKPAAKKAPAKQSGGSK